MGISYQKKRQTPKRGAGSSNLPEDATRRKKPAGNLPAGFLLPLRCQAIWASEMFPKSAQAIAGVRHKRYSWNVQLNRNVFGAG